MKTIICGGRDYIFTSDDISTLSELRISLPITEVVSGRCRGADRCGEEWANSVKLKVTPFPALWHVYKRRRAGMFRNQQMADYADACIAFPGGSGTADMVERAQLKRLVLIDLRNCT